MTPEYFTWKEFTHAILLNASTDEVFDFVGTSNGLCKWFLGDAVFTNDGGKVNGGLIPEAGDYYHWKWLAKTHEVAGKVIATDPGHKVKYTFGAAYFVTFTITAEEKGLTRLTLRQQCNEDVEFNEFNYINCCIAWTFFLTNLKSVMEQGIDLRETRITSEMLVNQ